MMIGAIGLGGLALTEGAVGLTGAQYLGERLEYVAENTVPSLQAIGGVESEVQAMQGLLGRHILAPTPEETVPLDKELDERIARVDGALEDYRPLLSDDRERSLYETVLAGWAAWKKTLPPLRQESLAIHTEAATAIFNGPQRLAADALVAAIEEQHAYNVELAAVEKRNGEQAAHQATLFMGGLSVLALVASALAVFMLRRRVLKPIGAMTDVMQRLARSENNLNVPYTGRRETRSAPWPTQWRFFVCNAIERQRLEAETAEQRRRAEAKNVLGQTPSASARNANANGSKRKPPKRAPATRTTGPRPKPSGCAWRRMQRRSAHATTRNARG